MFTYLKNTPVVFATLIAAIALVGTAWFAVNGIIDARTSNTLSVTGSAEKIVASDAAKWTFSITRSAATDELKDAVTKMQADVKKVQDFLEVKGIAKTAIDRAATEIQNICFSSNDSNYDRSGNRICSGGGSYALSARITINTDKAKEMGDISQQVTEYALSQGITIGSPTLEYYFNGLSDLRITLLGEATKNAEARARAIVGSTGKRLGNLQSASMGVFQVTAKQSVDFSDYGSYDTSTYEKKVTAIVRTAFSIK